jgi:hypothetical protein
MTGVTDPRPWVPAFAGMTAEWLGMTEKENGPSAKEGAVLLFHRDLPSAQAATIQNSKFKIQNF